jgi:hypothetical protein
VVPIHGDRRPVASTKPVTPITGTSKIDSSSFRRPGSHSYGPGNS